jgi:hypothetical protein
VDRRAQPNQGNGAVLQSVSATSATSAWAVGFTQTTVFGSGTLTTTLAEHWDGTAWTIVGSPSPGTDARLSSVTATSATNAWAVGSTGIDTGRAPFER